MYIYIYINLYLRCNVCFLFFKTPNCPGKHGLTLFTTQHSGYECDVNNESQPVFTKMYGCRICDYDACVACYNPSSSKGLVKKLRKLFCFTYLITLQKNMCVRV